MVFVRYQKPQIRAKLRGAGKGLGFSIQAYFRGLGDGRMQVGPALQVACDGLAAGIGEKVVRGIAVAWL